MVINMENIGCKKWRVIHQTSPAKSGEFMVMND